MGCEVGTGVTNFEPLADGDEVSIVAGPQGGYHINTSARVFDMGDSYPILISASLRLTATDEYLGPGISVGRLNESLSPEIVALGLRNFVNDPQQARGQQVTLSIVVEDANGAQAFDECIVVAH